MVNTMASGLSIRLLGFFPPLAREEVGDVFQHRGRLVRAVRRRQPSARLGQFPRSAHLQRVEQEQDAVGCAEIPDVLLDGLLRAQVLTGRIEERQQGPLRVPAPEDTAAALGGKAEHERCPVVQPRRCGRRQQLGLAVQRPFVLAGEPLPGVIVRPGDRRVELLPSLVHQLVHEHGHEDGLAGFFGPHRHDQAAADLAEVHREATVADRADPDGGRARAGGAVGCALAAIGREGRRQRAAESGPVPQHRVGLRRAASAVTTHPAGAPEPDLPLRDLLIAIRAVAACAVRQLHRSFISSAGGGRAGCAVLPPRGYRGRRSR